MKSTTRFTKNIRGIECLNCGQPISENDNFCSNCSQVNDELPLSIKQFISEFFAGFFSFDSRFFKTFVPLLFKPGKVSKDYVIGKRRRYVNPFQLYLHVTILFFLVQGLFLAIDEYKIVDIEPEEETTTIAKDSILNNVEEKENIVLNLSQNDTVSSDSIKTPKTLSNEKIKFNNKKNIIKVKVDSIFKNSNIIAQLSDTIYTKKDKDSIYDKYYEANIISMAKLISDNKTQNWKEVKDFSNLKDYFTQYTDEKFRQNNISYSPPEETKISVEDQLISGLVGKTVFKKISDFMAYDKDNEDAKPLEALNSLGYEKTRWNVFYFKKAQDFNKLKDDNSQIKGYFEEMVSKTSVALFFMLPIFTLFLSLLYLRHKRNYTEHLVFVFNIQTVFFLLLLFAIILNRIVNTDIGFILSVFVIVFLFYLYKSLRNFYNQGRIKTIIKFILLNFAYLILAFLGVMIVGFTTFAL
jgi:hypothetical protein